MVKPKHLSSKDLKITKVQLPSNSYTVFKGTFPQEDVYQCSRHKDQGTKETLEMVLVAMVYGLFLPSAPENHHPWEQRLSWDQGSSSRDYFS